MIDMKRMLAVAVACVLAVCGLIACGDDDDSSGSSDSKSSGPESEPFTYGYSLPTGQNPWINAIADAAEAKAAEKGGEMTRTDAQIDTGKAVQQVNRFITDGVSSITMGPAQVPQALQATLNRAVEQDIEVFALEWSFQDDPAAPPAAPVQGQVNIDRGKLGADVAAAAEEGAGGDAKVVYVGLPFPVASIDFFEENMRKTLSGGSEVVANVDNPTDNAQGALKPLNGALAAHPETNAIVTYNGPSALAAVQAVKSAGMTEKVKIYNIQLDTPTAEAIKAGTIEASWDLNPPELGTALGELIAAAGSGAPQSEWAKTVVIEAPEYTTDNIGDWKDWATG